MAPARAGLRGQRAGPAPGQPALLLPPAARPRLLHRRLHLRPDDGAHEPGAAAAPAAGGQDPGLGLRQPGDRQPGGHGAGRGSDEQLRGLPAPRQGRHPALLQPLALLHRAVLQSGPGRVLPAAASLPRPGLLLLQRPPERPGPGAGAAGELEGGGDPGAGPGLAGLAPRRPPAPAPPGVPGGAAGIPGAAGRGPAPSQTLAAHVDRVAGSPSPALCSTITRQPASRCHSPSAAGPARPWGEHGSRGKGTATAPWTPRPGERGKPLSPLPQGGMMGTRLRGAGRHISPRWVDEGGGQLVQPSPPPWAVRGRGAGGCSHFSSSTRTQLHAAALLHLPLPCPEQRPLAGPRAERGPGQSGARGGRAPGGVGLWGEGPGGAGMRGAGWKGARCSISG